MSIGRTQHRPTINGTSRMHASPSVRLARPRLIAAAVLVVCTTASTTACTTDNARAPIADSYIKYVAWEAPGHENVLLRWQKRQMPLKVHLPRPPATLFDDPEAIQDSVRDGILDWTDIVAPNVPSFVFVDDQRDADIPVVWAEEPDGDWMIAHCAMDIEIAFRRFGVSRILVTGRFGGKTADMHDIHQVVTHEMGHALGMGGHSPDPEDIMYRSYDPARLPGLTKRDINTVTALYQRPNGKRVTGARSADR